jgi:hypothetical protein
MEEINIHIYTEIYICIKIQLHIHMTHKYIIMYIHKYMCLDPYVHSPINVVWRGSNKYIYIYIYIYRKLNYIYIYE